MNGVDIIMLIWQWGLIASSLLLSLTLVLVLFRYFSLKRKMSDPDVDQNVSDKKKHSGSKIQTDASTEEKKQWLSLLNQQKSICAQLLAEVSTSDFQAKASLSCWAIFLDVEIHIIEASVPHSEIMPLLAAFKKILEKIDKAQEIDALFKSLKVNQTILNELNKVILRAGEKVSSQADITSDLNAQLDKLQATLAQEPKLDDELALLRAEMASLCEFIERLKLHLAEVKDDEGNEAYIETLEAFLNDSNESDFLNSIRSELDYKVADLKQLAANQKEIIAELKEQVRKAKEGVAGDDKHVGVYEVSIARLEKALLESGHVVKRLEVKLDSLQTIKYNLNIDVMKRDEALKQKTAELALRSDTNTVQGTDIYGVFDEERNTMKNMEDLLYQDSFTEEGDSFANEQASKISSLRLMVNESELYVEMLEKDLDRARVLRENLEHKLLNPNDLSSGIGAQDGENAPTDQDLAEVENLREINEELDVERKRLLAELKDAEEQAEEFEKLQEKVDKIDEKIESVQEKYVEMEARYLAALMDKEDK
jgi:chromosome segregation ATPase